MNIKSLIMLPMLMSGASFMLDASEIKYAEPAMSYESSVSVEENNCFAIASDLHLDLSVEKSALLRKFVERVNEDPQIAFAVFLGDLTLTGSDAELKEAQEILTSLQKDYYVLPGNNDLSRSESGGETFFRLFGRNAFDFEFSGVRFIGDVTVPMSMNSGEYAYSSIERMSRLMSGSDSPVIFFTHTPMYETYRRNPVNRNVSSLMLEALKSGNIQLIVSGEGLQNDIMDVEGVPTMIVASLDGNGKECSCFNKVNLDGKILKFENVDLESDRTENWFYIRMSNGKSFTDEKTVYPEPYRKISDGRAAVKWTVSLNNDLAAPASSVTASGTERSGIRQVCADVKGCVYAIGGKGSVVWKKNLDSPVYGALSVAGDKVIVGSVDGQIRCLSLSSGAPLWRYQCDKAVLACAEIQGNKVYVGASDNRFRCLDLSSGRLLWTFSEVEGPVTGQAYADKSQVIFADAMNNMYCLGASNGRPVWKWTNHKNGKLPDYDKEKIADLYSGNVQDVHPQHLSVYSRIFRSGDKYFLSTPEDKLFALRDNTGFQVWYSRGATSQVLMSPDGKQVFVLAPEGRLYAMNALSEKPQCLWTSEAGEPIAATDMCINGKYLFFSTEDGYLIAFDTVSRRFVWKQKVSEYPLSGISLAGKNAVCVTASNGEISLLEYSL